LILIFLVNEKRFYFQFGEMLYTLNLTRDIFGSKQNHVGSFNYSYKKKKGSPP